MEGTLEMDQSTEFRTGSEPDVPPLPSAVISWYLQGANLAPLSPISQEVRGQHLHPLGQQQEVGKHVDAPESELAGGRTHRLSWARCRGASRLPEYGSCPAEYGG